jgi:hypothetical protein
MENAKELPTAAFEYPDILATHTIPRLEGQPVELSSGRIAS